MKPAASPLRARLTPQGRTLAEDYLPFAWTLVNRLLPRHRRHRDDLESAAMMALVLAALSYDPAAGVNFATWVRRHAKGAFRDALHRVGCYDRPDRPGVPAVGSYEEFGGSGDDRGAVVRVVAPPPGPPESEAFEAMLSPLPGPFAEFCRGLYRDGLTFRAAAVRAGYSPDSASSVNRRALRLLRKGLEGRDR